MTGAELIEWIRYNEMQDKDVYVYDSEGVVTEATSVRVEDIYGFIITRD